MENQRAIYPGQLHHSYQRSDGKVIFYSGRDCLVFFTIAMTAAKRFMVDTIGLCIMRDHIHQLTVPRDAESFIKYHSQLSSTYSREFNADCGRKGRLFADEPFGSAPKFNTKSKMAVFAYLENNPVARHMCKNAEDYRWNFLAYAENPNPFSEKTVLRHASTKLRNALKEVAYCQTNGLYLHYAQIDRMFNGLSPSEKEQLTDFIVSKYSRLDYKYMIDYYGTYDNMLYAFRTNSGSEYDLNEEKYFGSDAIYDKMSEVVMSTGMVRKIKEIISLPDREKTRLAAIIRARTGADNWHLSRFLWKAW